MHFKKKSRETYSSMQSTWGNERVSGLNVGQQAKENEEKWCQ